MGATEDPSTLEQESPPSKLNWIARNFGVNYNTFFFGPGIGQPLNLPPGMTGMPSDSGLNFFNLISAKWKFSERFALDVQFRNQLVVTNQWEFRHQGQRFGVSGTLLKGENWALTGAINSDLPVREISGQLASERTLITNPGMWATFSYNPEGSRWSAFALLHPRVWFYADRSAIAQQDVPNGGVNNKPEYMIYLNPSINYAASDTLGFRLGTAIDVTKNIGWDGPRRNYMPFEFGVTYNVSPALSIYTFLVTSTPLDDDLRRMHLNTDNPPNWTQTASINVWLSGTLF